MFLCVPNLNLTARQTIFSRENRKLTRIVPSIKYLITVATDEKVSLRRREERPEVVSIAFVHLGNTFSTTRHFYRSAVWKTTSLLGFRRVRDRDHVFNYVPEKGFASRIFLVGKKADLAEPPTTRWVYARPSESLKRPLYLLWGFIFFLFWYTNEKKGKGNRPYRIKMFR